MQIFENSLASCVCGERDGERERAENEKLRK